MQGELGLVESDLGIGNRLTLLDDEILDNLNDIQLRNGLPPSTALASGDFTVEMETGTGKTYVYLRTIFELNKRYGFTKFVIVVPSVAIKEGVYKTLQITEEHFKGLYAGAPFDYFLYDSAKLGQVRNFATSPHIQIMVVTVGAINKKDVNNLYKDSEKTGGEKPIDLIRATRPILIVDEPQSVDGGLDGRGQEGAGRDEPALHPALLGDPRRQAPHGLPARRGGRLRAQAGEADRSGLAATVEGGHNKPYVRLRVRQQQARRRHRAGRAGRADGRAACAARRSPCRTATTWSRLTGRAIYADCRIGEIRVGEGQRVHGSCSVPGGETLPAPGQAVGDVDADCRASAR